jgi:hypothetical protein
MLRPHTNAPEEDSFAPAPARNSRRPPIPAHSSIGEYSPAELLGLVDWVQSDGRLRTHDEIADEMFSALPFSRRGSKIEAALKNAIQRWERTKGK